MTTLFWLLPLFNRQRQVVGYAKLDYGDFVRVKGYRWHGRVNATRMYARRCYRGTDGRICQMMLHRALVGPAPSGHVVDHINRDTLDNRRHNLRFVTYSGNMQNRGVVKYNTSGYRGVTWDAYHQKWRVLVKRNGRKVFSAYVADEKVGSQMAQQARRVMLPDAMD